MQIYAFTDTGDILSVWNNLWYERTCILPRLPEPSFQEMRSNGNRKHQPRGWHLVQETFLTVWNETRNDSSNTSTITGRIQWAKYNKCLLSILLANCYSFQFSFGRTHIPTHWGHARGHGKRSLEMLTVDRTDYAHHGLSSFRSLVSTQM